MDLLLPSESSEEGVRKIYFRLLSGTVPAPSEAGWERKGQRARGKESRKA